MGFNLGFKGLTCSQITPIYIVPFTQDRSSGARAGQPVDLRL